LNRAFTSTQYLKLDGLAGRPGAGETHVRNCQTRLTGLEYGGFELNAG
jgi:hypothetical protein